MQGLLPRYVTRYDLIEAWYWWLADHHTGQWSLEYKRLCKIGRIFKPGMAHNGPTNDISQEIYDTLCEREGCTHDV